MVHQFLILIHSIQCWFFFSKSSGLRINSSKTKIVWIGSKQFSNQVFHHIRWKLDWECTTFILLGIEFSVKLNEVTLLNFNLQFLDLTMEPKNSYPYW